MKKFNISHPTQLNSLSTLPFVGMKTVGELKLTGNMSEHPEKESFEELLNKHYYACGCDTGATGLISGLLLSSGYIVYTFATKDISVLSSLGTILGVSIGAAILGKLYGLVQANQKLQGVIESIQKEWKPEKEAEENWLCG